MRGVFVSVTITLVAIACGGSSTSTTSVTAAQACADSAHGRCSRLEACSPTVVALQWGDEATCETRNTENCVDSLSQHSNGNTPAHTEACAQAYAAWACTDLLNNVNVPSACVQQTGAVANGSPCAVPGQCETGFCSIAPGSSCGTCAALPVAGASCAALTSCGAGLVCTSDTQQCVAYAGSGAACGKGAPCGTGLSCVGSNSTTNVQGTCQTAVAASGATCDPTQKAGAGCDRNAGLVCNGQSKQCAALALASGGQACGYVSNQTADCASSGVCTGAVGTTTPGTCTTAAADGTACDTANGPGCMNPARCVTSGAGTTGTCEFGAGDSC